MEVNGGAVVALVEIVHGPQPLVIFGGGYDAIPLTRMAKELGYHVTVVDARPAYAEAGRFPGADAVILARPEQLAAKVKLTERTAAVIMSHNYLNDAAALQALAPHALRYLGLMGPRKRAEKMAADFGKEGGDPAILQRAHNPIGLDIGADTPEQIALAILAEIQGGDGGARRRFACARRKARFTRRMKLSASDFDYALPPELIAQEPAGAARRLAAAGF